MQNLKTFSKMSEDRKQTALQQSNNIKKSIDRKAKVESQKQQVLKARANNTVR